MVPGLELGPQKEQRRGQRKVLPRMPVLEFPILVLLLGSPSSSWAAASAEFLVSKLESLAEQKQASKSALEAARVWTVTATVALEMAVSTEAQARANDEPWERIQ